MKNKDDPENPGRWIDNGEMDYMVNNSHPDPEQGENSRNDSRRQFAFTKGQSEGNNPEHIRQYLDRPNGCIVGSENVEELLNCEGYSHRTSLAHAAIETFESTEPIISLNRRKRHDWVRKRVSGDAFLTVHNEICGSRPKGMEQGTRFHAIVTKGLTCYPVFILC